MKNNLTTLLWEVYNPSIELEDFMAAPEQHLPERAYTCKDCGMSFPSAADFTDHFDRLIGEDGKSTIIVTGCPLKDVN